MKTWLNKLRISWAMDSGKPLPDSLLRTIAADPELQQFSRQTQSLEGSAKASTVAEHPLHHSIMQSVRNSRHAARRPEPKHSLFLPWASIGVSVAAVALVCFGVLRHHRQVMDGTKSLNEAVAVLQLSEKVTNTMPYLLTPYSNELARVDRNLEDTKKILLASFP